MQLSGYLQRFDKSQLQNITSGLGAPIVLLAIMGMVILPMPPFLLDVLFSFNIALSLVIILVAVLTQKPVDFGIFPLVLLIATVLRLALNVASTRVVLLYGHEGGDAAGKVIEAFGAVVIGGNYAVGVVVFAILLIINFKVVTAGAGRISEVSARFTLDAMPGKQMAIDADLNAGYIDQDQARARREEITAEADFYGSMDGASKFVKGDAVAGLFIMLINIVGGLFIGMIQHGLSFGNAIEVYTILTIGDGLVAQIPSLLLSVATAIIVTRENETQEMGKEIRSQLGNSQALYIASGVLFVMGIIPGMPHLAFIGFSVLIAGYAYWQGVAAKREAEKPKTPANIVKDDTAAPEIKELGWDDVQHVDTIGLEVGYRLIPLVDKSQGGELLTRIKGVRKKLSQELGFLIPPVHIRDNLDLEPNLYTIAMLGVTIGDAQISHDEELAINPGQVFGKLEGRATKDPAFGLDAVWIKPNKREHAQTLGYTVVDAATVVATHLSQLLTNNAYQLLGHEEAQQLLDMLAKQHPKLVEGLVPDILPLSTIVKVLQTLLFEGVPIRDMRTIVQTLSEYGPRSQDPDVLVSAVRIALKRLITQEITQGAKEIPVITLAPELEQMLHQSLQAGGEDGAGIEPGLADKLQKSLQQASQQQELEGEPAVLLTSGMLRPVLSRFLKYSVAGLHVLSYQEVPDDKQIKIVSSVGQ
ncbi:flagellar biosynthesis protein FlhA [Alteromonas sp. 76-1]|jgi:flagellar biosynthesis protein FlhA|uniref:flagellar biosynthesis protein FlhA n=1 Tax=Alteromonas TaxID=226 RepID=UPI000FD1815C|nr:MULTISPECIES: flagellar biosynthesis protein FlhA [Alteromonas]MCQ8849575.1 flagellar biosynthesis protein FlhA [Alteromonas stellipolaris]VEL96100.1 flagellar biosynthesis protein FlhA [Alteromonas sp. 76-1]